jgi:hypothetical protein
MTVEQLQKDVSQLKDQVSYLITKVRQTEARTDLNRFSYNPYNRFNYTPDATTKFMTRDEILTLLIQFNVRGKELSEITNYKRRLEEELEGLGYEGRPNNTLIRNWLERNNHLLQPMNEEMEKTKINILALVEKRKNDYEESKNKSPSKIDLD